MKKLLFILFPLVSFGQNTKSPSSRWEIINQTLVGREAVFGEYQDTTVITDPGSWSTQPYNAVKFFNTFNAYKQGGSANMRFPLRLTIDLRERRILNRIKIEIGTDVGFTSIGGHIRVYGNDSGLVKGRLLGTLTDNGTITGTWQGINVGVTDTIRFIHIVIDTFIKPIGGIVISGKLIDIVPNEPVGVNIPLSTDSSFGFNIVNSMGYEKLTTGIMYATKATDVREFEWFNFFSNDTSIHQYFNFGGYGFDSESSRIVDSIQKYSNFSTTLNNATTKRMWDPRKPLNNTLEQQKAINWRYNTIGDTTSTGYDRFSDIGIHGVYKTEDPWYYTEAAWMQMRWADTVTKRIRPIKVIEPMNEPDGWFAGNGQYLPFELGAIMTAIYDGDENKLSYNGSPVGIKNCHCGVESKMPGISVFDTSYLKALRFYFRNHRSDHRFAADIGNVHSYPSTATGQGFNGVGLSPENTTFDLRGKMAWFKKYCNDLGIKAENTEIGWDTRDSLPLCDVTYPFGHSFTSTPHVQGQTIDQTQGNMVAQLLAIMKSLAIKIYYYWLADRAINKVDCGTFNSSGLLNLDTIISYSPHYSKRVSYYYFRAMDSLMKKKIPVSDTLYVVSGDSIRVHKYRKVGTQEYTFLLWSPTIKNASFSYTLNLGNTGPSTVKEFQYGSEVPVTISTSNSQTLSLTITEKPLIVIFNSQRKRIRIRKRD